MRMSALSDVVQKLKPEGAYELLAKAQALERQGHSVINFGIGQPDFASPPTAVDAAKKALDEGKTTYCNPSGTAELKSALAEHMLLTRKRAGAGQTGQVAGGHLRDAGRPGQVRWRRRANARRLGVLGRLLRPAVERCRV